MKRPDAIHTPKSDCVIGGVIKETRLVQVRPKGESVKLPRADAGLHFESVKTQTDIWALRTSMRRPEPYSISCLPALNLIQFRLSPVLTSRNAD